MHGMSVKLSDFDYDLPGELIAQRPVPKRDGSRLMVLNRADRSIDKAAFSGIVRYFHRGDLLVLNDTRVVPARLYGRRKTGGKVELFVLEKGQDVCEVLVKPSGRLKEGEKVVLESGDGVEILGRGLVGRFVRFRRPAEEIMSACGHTPLPPYIRRRDEEADIEAYQTVYARRDGATAAPTAGLHFTEELLRAIESRGVIIACVTLHTSYGTFAPVKAESVQDHRMHREYFECPESTARAVREAKARGSSVFAVGTTSARVLEHCALQSSQFTVDSSQFCAVGFKGYTDLFIYPGFEFQVVDHLITNFHLPKSTLLLLVSAFAGKDFIFEAYRKAIQERYRFFSYGDAMLIM